MIPLCCPSSMLISRATAFGAARKSLTVRICGQATRQSTTTTSYAERRLTFTSSTSSSSWRFFSSQSTSNTPKTLASTSTRDEDDELAMRKNNEASTIRSRDDLKHNLSRLLETSRDEWSLIALSASTLLVTSSVTLLLPYASGSVIDYTIHTAADGSGGGGDGALSPLILASGLFGLSALGGAGVYLRSLWLARAGNRIVARLKQRLFTSTLQQDVGYLDTQTTTGDLLSRLTSDAQLVQGALTTQAVAGLRATVMSLGAGAMMVYTSPTLTFVSCATLPPIFIMARYFGRKLRKEQEQVQKLLGDATSLAEQSLSNIPTVKQFTAEIFESIRYRNSIAEAHTKSVDTAHMQAQLETLTHIAGNAAILGVLGIGGQMVLDESISAGDLTGFVMYSLLLAGNLSSLTSIYSDLVRAMAASGRIFDLIDRTPQIVSSHVVKTQQHINDKTSNPLQTLDLEDTLDVDKDTDITKQVSMIEGDATIEFNNLSFHYPNRPDVPVLKNFNLKAPPGSVIAMVGASGSGKSTLASLITRLYDPDDNYQHDVVGEEAHRQNYESHRAPITINGTDIRKIDPYYLRRMISVVPQDPVLFRGTIRDNIRYGQWDLISDDDVLEAAHSAFVLDFALNFPDGLDTLVGPRGMQLSGGQRQRVALARMLANKKASIYILDEATSALDAASEHFVQTALQKLFEDHSCDKTIISIAHRLSTIRHATTVVVIDNGTVVQTGTFDELSTQDGPFRQLMKTQLFGDIDRK